MKFVPWLAGIALLAGCGSPPQEKREDKAAPAVRATDPLHFVDAKGRAFAEPPVLRAQLLLDRLGFSPGVIDGKDGASYVAALRGFQAAKGLDPTGALDEPTQQVLESGGRVAATRVVIVSTAFAAGPFVPDFPDDPGAQAKLSSLGYRNLIEALAERFHTTPETLVALNTPDAKIGAGLPLRVPNIADVDPAPADQDARGWSATLQRLGVTAAQPAAAKIVVDKSEGLLRVFDASDRVIAQFPATMGSHRDPLPIGEWKIQGVSRNPDFHYNPKLFWDVSDGKDDQLLPPGPNGPVGVAWIDISKPHYGIHGTNEPQTIGRAESHGCVRLTNWDAARLAQMVKPGTPAIFQK